MSKITILQNYKDRLLEYIVSKEGRELVTEKKYKIINEICEVHAFLKNKEYNNFFNWEDY